MNGSLGDGVRQIDVLEVGRLTTKEQRKKRKEHASTGFSAATIRALSARLLTFYFRAPIKAFFRPRIE